MLVRLMYASRAGEPVDADALAAILKRSKEHNPTVGVTGVLCFCTSAHIFMQVLEGGRDAVSALYNRIAQDPRHRDVALLSYEEIGERSFAQLVDGAGQHEPAQSGAGPEVLRGHAARSVRGLGPGVAGAVQRAGRDGVDRRPGLASAQPASAASGAASAAVTRLDSM